MAQQTNFVFSKPPLIDTEKFGIWAELFECHVRGKNQKIWDIIENGNFKPTIVKDDVFVDKPLDTWTTADESHFCLNFEAKNILYAALTTDEIERVYTYKTANQIWESLNNTHRGNTEVKSSKVNILVHDYELFEMSQDESIDSMFKRFNLIMTTLKGLGRIYPNEDYIRKILRALPSEWMQKITSLEDSRDLSLMKIDDLIGNLKVHEIALKRNKDREQVKKKSIALNASTTNVEKKKEKASSSKDSSETLDEVAMLVRNFSKFFNNKKFSNNGRFQRNGNYRRGGENRSRKFHKREEKVKKDNDSSDDDKAKPKRGFCYSCGDKDHYANECPKKNKFQNKKEKAFVGGAWSASEEEDDYQAICLMAESDNEVNTSYSNYDSDYDSDNENNLELLHESFHKMANLANNYKDEIAKLKETVNACKKEINNGKQKSENDMDIIAKLETKLGEKDFCKSCDVLNKQIACLNKKTHENVICTKCDILENEITCLKAKCDVYEKDNRLANAFQSSNDKVLKMLNMSNRIKCRKGIGSDTCKDKCSCMPIKRYFESPKFNTRKPYVQKPPYVPKMHNVNYNTRKPYARMYNEKYSKPRINANTNASFYVYDKYNRKIKMVNKWIPKGMFCDDNPGGMRLWF